jgi:voltage-gated potassium channel
VDGRSPTDVAVTRHPLLVALLRTTGSILAVLVLYFVLPLDRGFSAGTVAGLAAGVLALGLLVAWQVRAILRSRHPAVRAVEAIALSLPLFLLLFAGTYVVLSGSEPGAFTEPLSRIDSLYFVVTVFATVGFGDITPVTEGARVLVTLQMVGDLLLIGLVLRLFLTAVDRGRRRAAGQEGPPPLTPGG